MEEMFVPFRGIKNDLRGRLMCYKQDWTEGFGAGFRYILLLPKQDEPYILGIFFTYWMN